MIHNTQRNFIVEGNIGAGKSTFVKLINNKLPMQIVLEPHNQWQSIGGEDLLGKFYQDTQRWAYTFQTYAFITRIQQQLECAKNNPFTSQIIERSVFSDRYCFALHHQEIGNVSNMEWHIYIKWFDWLVNTYLPQPTGFIYLRTKPETCYERMKKRARSVESEIPLDYLQALHEKHERWLIKKENVSDNIKNIPLLILDCDTEFESNQDTMQEHINQITRFINKI